MWELSEVLAVVDVLPGRIPTANDRVQREFAVLYTDITLGSLALNSAVCFLSLFWAPLVLSVPLGHL